MGKRGQVTIFVILGIVILAVIGVLVYIISTQTRLQESEVLGVNAEETLRQVYNDIDLCLKKYVDKGVLNAAEHDSSAAIENRGFYCLAVDEVIPTPTREIHYDYYPDIDPDSGEIVMKSAQSSGLLDDVSNFKSCLEGFILDKVPPCLGQLSSYEEKGWDVEWSHESDINVNVELEEKVIVDLEIPARLRKGDVEFKLEKRTYVNNADFRYVFGIKEEIKRRIINLGQNVDVAVVGIENPKNFGIEWTDNGIGGYIFMIYDRDNTDFRYFFGLFPTLENIDLDELMEGYGELLEEDE